MGRRLATLAMHHPRVVFLTTLILTLIGTALIPLIEIDTDPENMLPAEQADRVRHNVMKDQFNLHDMIVVGVVNESHEQGVFNPRSLEGVHRLSEGIAEIDGVIRQDLLSLATVDNIEQAGPGTIRFEWMMNRPPADARAARDVRDNTLDLPLYRDTLVSGDGEATALYVPIEAKDQSYRIAGEIRSLIADLDVTDTHHITGLPVAEDTFGVEMFIQMAISAPLAALVIFALMWWFFRSVTLVIAPMLMAFAVVLTTMGTLIGMGYTVHIMSSMIPIFLMPIAVVDSVHIISEFADRYRPERGARETMKEVMGHLFTPMLYTSVTSAIGFASLAFTPIPPVQVFGLFVAGGILLAFVLTILFIPAYAAVLGPARLASLSSAGRRRAPDDTRLARGLSAVGRLAIGHAHAVVLIFAASLGLAAYGISQITVNDNPVRWFQSDHPIRVADRVLNEHFAGTYSAYLRLSSDVGDEAPSRFETRVDERLAEAEAAGLDITQTWQRLRGDVESKTEDFDRQLEEISLAVEDEMFAASDAAYPFWEDMLTLVDDARGDLNYFKRPAALDYIAGLQDHLVESEEVGKVNTLADLVRTVYRELRSGEDSDYRIPESRQAVAQTILSFQGSHRPQDLWRTVTPDYQATNLWLQLSSGDNQDMEAVVDRTEAYIADNPLPDGVSMSWGGLNYINVVWQDAMVKGMAQSLAIAWVMVAFMMLILFRSVIFGLLAMVPLTVSIALIYGVVGLIGKYYDMPIAVLSSLTLGLSVDFAIHFIERSRETYRLTGNFTETMRRMFKEPARAISRNAIVIAVGFLPLLAAPLVPYNTVGIFLASIMAASALASIILLPALLSLMRNRLMPDTHPASDTPSEDTP
ncbi:MAG: MMPL family transporter [Spiribacter sp.]|nr:MMPL family transporter [Spiribacter sp.]MDR9454097.1 MMPL family transporter [Spiribacter sp.]